MSADQDIASSTQIFSPISIDDRPGALLARGVHAALQRCSRLVCRQPHQTERCSCFTTGRDDEDRVHHIGLALACTPTVFNYPSMSDLQATIARDGYAVI